MKPSFILGAVLGYVLGARAGRPRYEEIVAIARRVAGSQTIQATAGVLLAQAHEATERARRRLPGRGDTSIGLRSVGGSNGHRR